MDLSNSKDEALLHYYESVRRQVDADRQSRHYRFASDGVKKYAESLRDEMERRRLRFRPIDWPHGS
jgi:hypothetical protein